jgi:hypothetical protein
VKVNMLCRSLDSLIDNGHQLFLLLLPSNTNVDDTLNIDSHCELIRFAFVPIFIAL